MSFKRWLPTFLGFPLGGLLAIQTVGSIHSPLSAAVAGALAGAVIGAAQWLALRSSGIRAWWVAATSAALAVGSTLTNVVTDAVGGLIAGAAIGAAQGLLFDRGPKTAAMWAAAVSVSWCLGWLTTWAIGVDVERGYAVFGSSGAVVVTLLTGLALRWLFGTGGHTPAVAPVVEAGV
jgi:outer membrane lipoprotein SlyB